MRLILHDLPPEAQGGLPPQSGETALFDANPMVRHCIGCFGCWTKTPGRCVIQDRMQPYFEQLHKAERLDVVSRCTFGGLSSGTKAVMDRSIGYILPFFYVHKQRNEMHHVPRHAHQMQMHYHLYGPSTPAEQETARTIVKANALNLNARACDVLFYDTPQEVRL